MNKIRILLTGAVLTAGIGAAMAQTVVISPENEVVIREYVVRQHVAPIEPPLEAEIIVGEPLPEAIEVYDLDVPELEPEYRYVVIDDRTVVVEPETRRIVHILE